MIRLNLNLCLVIQYYSRLQAIAIPATHIHIQRRRFRAQLSLRTELDSWLVDVRGVVAMTLDRAEDSPIATTLTTNNTDSFGGLKLEDLPVHESVLEKKRDEALAKRAPRKSPQRVPEPFVPLECILKPHVSILERRKSDQNLVSKYQTSKEKDNQTNKNDTVDVDVNDDPSNPHDGEDQ